MKRLLVMVACGMFLVACKKTTAPQTNKGKESKKAVVKTQAPKKAQKPSLVLAGAALAKGTKVEKGTTCRIHVGISGMMCPTGCAPKVRTTLKGVDGISEAYVSYKTKSATVDARGEVCAGKTTQQLITKAFAKETYKCKVNKIELFAKKAPAAKAAKGTKATAPAPAAKKGT